MVLLIVMVILIDGFLLMVFDGVSGVYLVFTVLSYGH
jgi:hypothetical protein